MRLARFEGSKSFHTFLYVEVFIAHDLSRVGISLKIEDGVAGTHSASTSSQLSILWHKEISTRRVARAYCRENYSTSLDAYLTYCIASHGSYKIISRTSFLRKNNQEARTPNEREKPSMELAWTSTAHG